MTCERRACARVPPTSRLNHEPKNAARPSPAYAAPVPSVEESKQRPARRGDVDDGRNINPIAALRPNEVPQRAVRRDRRQTLEAQPVRRFAQEFGEQRIDECRGDLRYDAMRLAHVTRAEESAPMAAASIAHRRRLSTLPRREAGVDGAKGVGRASLFIRGRDDKRMPTTCLGASGQSSPALNRGGAREEKLHDDRDAAALTPAPPGSSAPITRMAATPRSAQLPAAARRVRR